MKIIDTRQETINNAFLFINNLIEEVYILGTNKYGEALAKWLKLKNIKVVGFINDVTNETTFAGLPIVKSTTKFIDVAIINCIVEGRTIDAYENIKKCNPKKTIDYFALQLSFITDLPSVDFLTDTDSIVDSSNDYSDLFNRLEDQISRDNFEKITNFRLSRDISFLEGFEFKIKEQYFEDFLFFNDEPSFIDGGGFDGETTKLFIQLYPKYNKVYYFEPTEESFTNSVLSLKNVPKISLFKSGLWNKTETLAFNNTLGSANKISTDGNVSINVVSIDEIIDEPVDYIKMDIEGAEYKALLGAKKHITKFRPKLAICVYHNQSDFIRIPKLILSFNPDYKIYLRHYTQGVFETVMYFV